MKNWNKFDIVSMCLLLLTLSLLAACENSETQQPTQMRTEQMTANDLSEEVTITIGNLTDLTGPSASAGEVINYALYDMVKYYNESNLIPGVKLRVIDYDTGYDPARFIPGYQWLKERGADLIYTIVPGSPQILAPFIEEDGMLMFSSAASKADLVPPGNIFMPEFIPEELSYTVLKWIAENDWDYETNGPAKIGAASWSTPYNMSLHDGADEYCSAHPDQFEWVGAYYIPPGTFNWNAEVLELKDCDYVMPPIHLTNWVKEYSVAGYETTYIGTGAQAAFFQMLHDARVWPEIDGMIFFGVNGWWNDDTEAIEFMKNLLYENHPGDAEQIIRGGSAYSAVTGIDVILEVIGDAVETVGPGKFNSNALMEAATSYSKIVEGLELVNFSDTKRYGTNYLPFYRADGDAKDLFMIGNELHPIIREP